MLKTPSCPCSMELNTGISVRKTCCLDMTVIFDILFPHPIMQDKKIDIWTSSFNTTISGLNTNFNCALWGCDLEESSMVVAHVTMLDIMIKCGNLIWNANMLRKLWAENDHPCNEYAQTTWLLHLTYYLDMMTISDMSFSNATIHNKVALCPNKEKASLVVHYMVVARVHCSKRHGSCMCPL